MTEPLPGALTARALLRERIDDPDLPAATWADAMRDLERVNRVLRAYRPTFAFLDEAARRGAARGGARLRILDVGSGHGDLLRAIHAWGVRRGVPIEGIGLDRSPAATAAAREATPPELGLRFTTRDLFAYRPDPVPDLVVSSLLTHHLSDAEIVRFLRWMEAHARLGWHLNDLRRHPLARLGFRGLALLLRLHPVVRHDGAISVQRGFTGAEWERLVAAAGLDAPVRVRGWFPFRIALDRLR